MLKPNLLYFVVLLGGNIPLDLALEHLIKYIKILRRRLGPNQFDKNLIDKYIKALPFTQNLLKNFDDMCVFKKGTGKHILQSVQKDKSKVVNELMNQKALVCKPGRNLDTFKGCKDSLLDSFDMADCFNWI